MKQNSMEVLSRCQNSLSCYRRSRAVSLVVSYQDRPRVDVLRGVLIEPSIPGEFIWLTCDGQSTTCGPARKRLASSSKYLRKLPHQKVRNSRISSAGAFQFETKPASSDRRNFDNLTRSLRDGDIAGGSRFHNCRIWVRQAIHVLEKQSDLEELEAEVMRSACSYASVHWR